MRKNNSLSLAFLFLLFAAAPALFPSTASAQDAKPPAESKPSTSGATLEDHRYFRLDFDVREIGDDGKVLNSRAYSVIVGSDDQNPDRMQPSSIRAGSKVTVPSSSSRTSTEYQYFDVGVNLDCRRVHLVQGQLSVHVSAEVSSMPDAPASNSLPVIRQNKWESDVVLPLNKPTILFSSDNVATKGKLQLELTAAPIK